MIQILYPVRAWKVTQTHEEHLKYAALNPGRPYNAGIDFYSDNRNIYACDDGTIYRIGYDADGYGYHLILKHNWGFSIYAHLLAQPVLQIGMNVARGEAIAVMGSTGFSTGTHLHFEVRDLQNKVFDSTPWLAESVTAPVMVELAVGDVVEVCAEWGANFRSKPSADYADVLQRLLPGKQLRVIGPEVDFGGLKWLPVEQVESGYVAKIDGEGTQLIKKIK